MIYVTVLLTLIAFILSNLRVSLSFKSLGDTEIQRFLGVPTTVHVQIKHMWKSYQIKCVVYGQ